MKLSWTLALAASQLFFSLAVALPSRFYSSRDRSSDQNQSKSQRFALSSNDDSKQGRQQKSLSSVDKKNVRNSSAEKIRGSSQPISSATTASGMDSGVKNAGPGAWRASNGVGSLANAIDTSSGVGARNANAGVGQASHGIGNGNFGDISLGGTSVSSFGGGSAMSFAGGGSAIASAGGGGAFAGANGIGASAGFGLGNLNLNLGNIGNIGGF